MSAVYDRATDTVYISAEELCAYVMRGGDLTTGLVRGNKNGSTITSHKICPEKPNISDAYFFSTVTEGITLTVYTYPEGIRKGEHSYTVEKIYNVPYSLDNITNGELDVAIASVMCSSYIVLQKLGGINIHARVLFMKDKSDEVRQFAQVCTREYLSAHFENLVNMFSPFARIIAERVTKTKKQLSELKFPFPEGVREGQRDFILDAFRSIRMHKRLMVQAPTGTGKTMASLYPALKSVGEGYADKIFYFTGKTTTAYSALNAVDIMRKMIPDFRSIIITSKEKCCTTFTAKDRRKCNPKHCLKTRAYFDKINVALIELLENYRTYTKDIIDEVAEKYSICSYELSLELSEWCELIVCDYNYLFDIQVYLRRYFTMADADYVFLIDEAHNLPDRAREMYSATLTRSMFVPLAKRYEHHKILGGPCVNVLQKMDTFHALAMKEKVETDKGFLGFYLTSQLPDGIENEFFDFAKACQKTLSKGIEDDELDNAFFEVRHMLNICEQFDKRFTMYIEADENDVKLRLLCLDPSNLLDLRMKNGVSTILFSATLTPPEYFADILGCEKTNTLNLSSPFERENLCLLAVDNVSTRYEDRKKSISAVANIIRASIAGKVGNYIVYFPSYAYLTEVKDVFEKKYPKINITSQSRSMSENAKKEFLDAFDAKKEGTLVGFCVLGGSFGEGIDLRGERLIGAIIVGVGLPTISSELNIIKEHFDVTRENGYAYAYTYPGMIKVLQAAGRVIRSEDERGVVVLIDDRFATQEYKDLMPDFWQHIKFSHTAQELLNEVTEFWKK